MKSCPTCGCEIADSVSVCESCEAWAAALVEPRPDDDAAQTSKASIAESNLPVPVATTARAERVTGTRRQLTFIASAAGALAGVALTGFAMSARGGSAPSGSATATAPTAHVTPAPATAPPATADTGVQKWSAENQPSRLDRRRREATFELVSENVVKTWLGPARPTLFVRCTSQRIEAFVVTGSPMKIDPRVEGKTVTISMDGEPVRAEQWTDSDDHTAVFAPDPAAFTQRLRTARTLHFGYSPHNSSDVVAQFHVSGIDGLIAAAPKDCGGTK